MILVVFLYLSSFLIITFTNAFITPTYIGNSCPSSLNFTINSTYHSNLKLLFSTLSSNATFNTSNGLSQVVFRSATAGQAPDEVYGLFLCRRDLNSTTCQDCVTYATRHVTTICPNRKLAIIWYDECHLRYSNQSFFSIVSQNPAIWMPNTENVTEPDKFDDSVLSLMNAAASKAAYSPDKFAGAKKENFRVNETLYGLVQCTEDLSSRDCFTCLRAANADLPVCCSGKRGGRVLTPSCNSRFELYSFFNDSFISTVDPAPAPEPPPVSRFPPAPGSVTESQGKGRRAVWIAIGTIIPTIIVLMLSGYFLPLIWRRYKEERAKRRALQVLRSGDEQNNLREQHEVESQDFPIFPLGQILEATRHFSDENKLGEGGFGAVYKGVLADGKDIAVKRLSRTSGQGLQEFKNEVTLIAKLQHKNLVRLLGCCLEEKEFLLIYEYMPNKSLNVHLFDSTSDHMQLDWKRRMSIINGIARGLLYLHEDSRLKIIHRDLKTSNILLDHDMNSKISDFGMARIFGGNQNEANTNRVVGTYGYMAPEYAMDGIFSVKSDVYSFGVLLLEIMSGRKNTRFHLSEHGESLLSYAWKLWCEGHALELMDPQMVQSCVPVEFLKFIHIGLLCVQENPVDRPTMSSIVVMLVSDTVTLPKPTQPAFSVGRFVGKSDQASSTTGKGSSINEVTISNVIPR